ncbi:MAG: penicillin acylase family protein [Myxococcota bacterium]
MNVVKRLARALLGARLPRVEGRLRVSGAHGRIIIQRDGWGIPSIDAVDSWDAWFGLGFCHAQDRGGQLELIARIVRGTLAEVVGEDALGIDRLVRRLGIKAAGAAQLAVADPDIRAQQDAYAAGINAGFAHVKGAHEHALLGIKPTRWEGPDAQALATFLCFALAANWDLELARWQIAHAHGVAALQALEPLPAEWLVASSPPLATPDFAPLVGALRTDLEALAGLVGLGGGSNAWAIAARKSATGRPIVAGDPHLPPQSPSSFYLARLECPEFLAIGATFPGVAALPSGHNGHLAWGITAAHLDNTDWFVEQLGADGKSVRRGDAFVPCEVRREVIAVKGRKRPVVEDVLVTSHGPIVSPALDGFEPHHARGQALALAATWLAPRPYRGLLGLHLCRDAASLRRCMTQASTTNVGLVYAAAPTDGAPEGHIGYLVAADVPVRKRGTGPMPQPGWDERFGWNGLIPNDRLPHLEDPDAGFVAAANNVPDSTPGAPDGAGDYLGADFLDGYRVTAISRALAGRGEWTLEACRRLQLDLRSLPWEETRAVILGALDDGPAKALLAGWDGVMGADSAAAALFAHVVAELCRRVVHAKAPGAALAALGRGATAFLPHSLLFARRTSHLSRLLREQPDGWFAAGWPRTVADAVQAAWDELGRRFGRDPSGWAWGRIRPLWLKHPFGEKAMLAKLFDLGPYAVGGDATTIPQASIDLRDPTGNPIGIAVFRQTIDVGHWDESRWALCGGQSGNPFSPHAEDQVPLWLTGGGVPIHASRAERARVVRHTLTLEVGP